MIISNVTASDGTPYTYKSMINGPEAIKHGKPMGTTTYFSESLDGTIHYPSNHVINFHRVYDQLSSLYFGVPQPGSKIIVPDPATGNLVSASRGVGHYKHEYDLAPFSSSYSVDVKGTAVTRIKVEKRNK